MFGGLGGRRIVVAPALRMARMDQELTERAQQRGLGERLDEQRIDAGLAEHPVQPALPLVRDHDDGQLVAGGVADHTPRLGQARVRPVHA